MLWMFRIPLLRKTIGMECFLFTFLLSINHSKFCI